MRPDGDDGWRWRAGPFPPGPPARAHHHARLPLLAASRLRPPQAGERDESPRDRDAARSPEPAYPPALHPSHRSLQRPVGLPPRRSGHLPMDRPRPRQRPPLRHPGGGGLSAPRSAPRPARPLRADPTRRLAGQLRAQAAPAQGARGLAWSVGDRGPLAPARRAPNVGGHVATSDGQGRHPPGSRSAPRTRAGGRRRRRSGS